MKRIALLAIMILTFGGFALAQPTDDLLSNARQLAKQKRYAEAQQACRDILAKDENGDVRFYLGLLYSWDGKYDDARREFKVLERSRPNSMELIIAQYNVEYWSENYSDALAILDKAIQSNPDDLDLRLKRAKMLNALGKRSQAVAEVKAVLARDPALLAARNLLSIIMNSNRKNTISTSFSYDFFDDSTDPWYSAYLQYGRRLSIGSIIARFNYTNRFNTNGYQFEADSYLSFWKGGYTYANIGFSGSSVFPDFRCGFEYYQNLPKSFEASLGIRYLKFYPSDVLLYTASVGKYYSSYWFSVRPQLRFKDSKTSYSFRITARRYFADPDTYLSLEGFFGTAPDFDHPNIDYSYLERLKSWGGKVGYNQKVKELWVISGYFGLSHDEILKDRYRNQYTVGISVSKSF